MTEGVDYSTARPNLDQLWALDKRFTCRYLAYKPNPKVLLRGEREALHAKGFVIVLNWEQAAGDMLKGYDKGHAHATEARDQAKALGAPESAAIYFSCDVDTTSDAQRAAVAQYLDACCDVLGKGRVGVYGEYDVIQAMLPDHATWGWQTYAWSKGQKPAKAHLYQYQNSVQLAGGDVDLNRTVKSVYGGWYPPGTEAPDMDALQSQRLTNDNQTLYALSQLNSEADGVKIPANGTQPPGTLHLPLVDLLKRVDKAVALLAQSGVTQDMLNAAVVHALQQPAVLQALAPIIQDNAFLAAQKAERE